jgi:tetratricopeptide (TPR) repeat protein
LRASGWFAIFLLAGLVFSAPGWSQERELAEAIQQSHDMRAQGKLEEAVPFAEKALSMGKGIFGAKDPNVAILLDNLAVLYHAQGKYFSAELLYKRALDVIEAAEFNYQRALAVREKALGPNHQEVANSLSKLAQLYHGLRRTSAAEFHFKRALKTYEPALGRKHPGIVRGLERYATFPAATGRSGEAEKYRSRAKEIRGKNAKK